MKTMLIAAAAALSLGVGSAYANESGPQAGGYVYANYQFPTHNAPPASEVRHDKRMEAAQSTHQLALISELESGTPEM